MKQVFLLAVAAFLFAILPRIEANRPPHRVIVPYADLPDPRVYAACEEIFKACRGPLCKLDQDFCVTWRRPSP